MPTTQLNAVLRHVQAIAANRKVDKSSDSQLLAEFADQGTEAAFAAILKRHGGMVLRVCRRVLQHEQDAEDAFQATFLVLARRAAAIRKKEAIASWLHGVAHRVAMNVKRAAARRRLYEERAKAAPRSAPERDLAWREVQAVLDEEICRLPEKYRDVFVLCHLEGLSRAEIARKSRLSEGVIAGRLVEARKRLRQRLARRGITLSALLGAVALTQNTRAAAVPPLLMQKTAMVAPSIAAGKPLSAGAVSAQVIAIMHGATRTMFTARRLFASGLILVLGALTAGAGTLLQLPSADGNGMVEKSRTAGAPSQGAKPKTRAASTPVQSRAKEEQAISNRASKDLLVSGRVLDRDGKPLPEAKLYLGHAGPTSQGPLPLGRSGGDGRFRFVVPRPDAKAADGFPAQVIALADAYRPDWAVVSKDEVTLRLLPQTTLNGRVLDSEGKAVAGAIVRVQRIERYPAADLTTHLEGIRKGSFADGWVSSIDYGNVKAWYGPFPDQPATIRTGADGRFRLSGFGTNEIVRLALEGPTIQHVGDIQVTSRPGPDAVWPDKTRDLRILGPRFDLVAALARPIRGLVRDQITGRPIAGAGIRSYATTHQAHTDAQGRFELLGHPKAAAYRLEVRPANGQGYFNADVSFTDTQGFGPLDVTIELVSGIACTGRLLDKDTGRPVEGARVHYYALYPNVQVRKLGADAAFPPAAAVTGADGSYRLSVLPGPGALAFRASRPDGPYMPASISRAELAQVFGDKADHGNGDNIRIAMSANGFLPWGVSDFNALVLFNPPESATSFTRDAFVQAGRTVTGRIVGPDDQPVTGVLAFGLRGHPLSSEYLAEATFRLSQLNPKETRKLVFLNTRKSLGTVLRVRGDEKGPLTVRLKPCGSATGQFLNADGEPLADLTFECDQYDRGPTPTKTDRDGRFRVDNLVPGESYTVHRRVSRPALYFHTCFGPFTVKPGEVKDLGQAKIKRDR